MRTVRFPKKGAPTRSGSAFFRCFVFILLVGNASAQTIGRPETFLMNGAYLEANKQKIAGGNDTLRNALKEWLKAADGALTRGPYSVVHKTKVPPSGDKHDYMSVGPYWWPDSTKPNGLPYVRRDGKINPERYALKDEGELNNLCDDTHLLAVAYYYTDDEKYARHAADLLRSWFLHNETRMNPNLNFGQAIPGITDGRGIGIIDTKDLVKLVDAVQLLKGSAAWPASDHAALQTWFRQFLDWMLTSPIGRDEEDEHNNHGTYYDFQTVAFALFTENKTLAKSILEQKTTQRIAAQLKKDGSQPHELARTLSWNYSLMNLRGFFGLALLGEQVQVDLWNYRTPDGKSLKDAFLWMVPYAEGKKSWEHQQIKPAHFDEFWPLARVVAARYANGKTPDLSGKTPTNDPSFLLTNSLF